MHFDVVKCDSDLCSYEISWQKQYWDLYESLVRFSYKTKAGLLPFGKMLCTYFIKYSYFFQISFDPKIKKKKYIHSTYSKVL